MQNPIRRDGDLAETARWLFGHPHTAKYLCWYGLTIVMAITAFHFAGKLALTAFSEPRVGIVTTFVIAFLTMWAILQLARMPPIITALVAVGVTVAARGYETMRMLGWDHSAIMPWWLLITIISALWFLPFIHTAMTVRRNRKTPAK